MKHVTQFLLKTLTSRKFWAAVAASLPFALNEDWTNFALVWMSYAGIQGAVDASERVGTQKAITAADAAKAVGAGLEDGVPQSKEEILAAIQAVAADLAKDEPGTPSPEIDSDLTPVDGAVEEPGDA